MFASISEIRRKRKGKNIKITQILHAFIRCAYFVMYALDADLHVEIDYSQLRSTRTKPEPHI